MSVVDIALLAIGCFFIVKGLFKGLSGEVMSLAAVIGGFYCSLRWREPISDVISNTFGISGTGASIIAMLAVFLCVYIVCAVIRRLLRRVIKVTSLTWLDKALGAAAGLLKIYVVCVAVLIVGMLIAPVAGTSWFESSSVLSATASTWPYVSPMLESVGISIDTDKLQEEARGFIMRGVGQNLQRGEGASETTDETQKTDAEEDSDEDRPAGL